MARRRWSRRHTRPRVERRGGEVTLHWCRFMFAGQASFGRIEGERIQRVEGAPFDAPRMTGDSVPLAGTQLLPPVLPFTFFCVGLNYRAHILHAPAKGMGPAKIPDRPAIG